MKKRDRAGRLVSTGNSPDGSGLAACIAVVPLRGQRRNEDMRDTAVGTQGDHRHAGVCCQEVCCPDRCSRVPPQEERGIETERLRGCNETSMGLPALNNHKSRMIAGISGHVTP
jgi:hypothetical protein